MIIPKPITFKPDPVNSSTTRLFFKDQKSADFYMVGALAWPDGKYPGFALLSGMNISDPDKKIWLFEEQEFWTVDNWLLPDGNLKEKKDRKGYWYGLSYFFLNCVSTFGCRSYFYGGQHPDIHRRYMLQVYGSKITPRPLDLIEVPYVKEVGDGLISEYTSLAKFVGDANSILSVATKAPDADENGPTHALKCLFAGYEYAPWVDIKSKTLEPIMYVR